MKWMRPAVSVLVILSAVHAVDVHAQVRSIYDHGAGALHRQLERLQTTASVLHTGAHPDDEDSALVAYHARGENARTAYLSLTRGSGGQNIIGAEQSDLLGIIRTEELLQARRLDGAEQYFTRANDFGFSKTREEGARLWDEEMILGDMVEAIRRFRPSVIVSRWDGTPRDGHGHHQFSGYLTPIAFRAAADPARFPEQISNGLEPWQANKLYVSVRGLEENLLVTNTGAYDPAAGRSYFEIGMHGRSQQKTQQMGTLELRGRQESRLRLIESADGPVEDELSIFDGLDTSITGIARFERSPNRQLNRQLRRLKDTLGAALTRYRLEEPATLIRYLGIALESAREASRSATSYDAQRLLREKIGEIETAIVLAAGVQVDALAESETLIAGQTFNVAIRMFDPGVVPVATADTWLQLPDGWSADARSSVQLGNEQDFRRREAPAHEVGFAVTVAGNEEVSQPYWLRLPREGYGYDWSEAGTSATLPFDPPLMKAEVSLIIGDTRVTIEREVEYRERDRVRGELRRRIDVVSAVSVTPATSSIIVPASSALRVHEVLLTIRNNSPDPIEGAATVQVPDGWALEPRLQSVSLGPVPATTTVSFRVTMPDDVVPGGYALAGSVSIEDQVFDQNMQVVAYPHIRTHRAYVPSETSFGVIDVDVAPVSVGYIVGSGDRVPEGIRRLGINVELLDDEMLTSGELDRFDTVVVGIRASQARPAFAANNQRLLDYVRAGGTMIVQYQQPDFIAQGLAPCTASMDGNVRVVDETAPIVILEPEHPVFTFPNQIGPEDFDGWIQERNNYNFTSFDTRCYLPLTEAHDPGEPDSEGGMLYARIGEGHYVYTSYSWFRQLPNGTPGAYRLFANLLSLPAAEWPDD